MSMISNGIRRAIFCLSVAMVALAAVGCGGDAGESSPLPSGEWGAAEKTDGAHAESANRPPEIVSLRFDPPIAVPGRSLRVFVETHDPDRDAVDLGYVWSLNGRRMPSDGSTIEVPDTLPRDAKISVEVIASDGQSTSAPSSTSTLADNRTPRVSELGIRVMAGEGDDLGEWIADPVAEDPEGDEIVFRYQWRLNNDKIVGQHERLSRNGWKRGDEIRLTVWASDGQSESNAFEAAPFKMENSPPDIVSRPPGLDSSGRFAYRVEAKDRDGDRGLRFSLEKGPEGMAIDPFSGQVQWQATPRHAGEHFVKIEVDDRQGGTSSQSFYVAVNVDSPGAASSPAAPAPN